MYVKKVIFTSVLYCLLIFSFRNAIPYDSPPQEIIVGSDNAQQYHITVKKVEGSCGNADYISIGFRKLLDDSIYGSANVSFFRDGEVMLSMPILGYQINESNHEVSLHGASFCLHKSIDYDIEFSLSYHIGDRESILLIIKLREFL